jgi:hypothetical protein
MFQDWQKPPGFGNIYSDAEILTQYGVKVPCRLDPYYMTLCTKNDKQMYDRPTLNGKPLSRVDFHKFQCYGFHRSMIRCDNTKSLVIWLSRKVKDSACPGQTLRIVMQQVEMKRKADGDIDSLGTVRLMQYPRGY